RLSLEQGHHKERLLVAVLVELPYVEDLDDVRMADRLEGAAFLVEELEGEGVGELVESLDGDLPVHRRWIIGAVNNAHAAFAKFRRDLIAPGNPVHKTGKPNAVA